MGELAEIHFREGEFELSVRVEPQADTVWLNRQQMAQLFDRDIKTIGKHIQAALREELEDSVVAKFATTAGDEKTYQVEYYNLDMIISVGYRVKSARGVQFRRCLPCNKKSCFFGWQQPNCSSGVFVLPGAKRLIVPRW